jgi:salicylate hydroxylase
LPDAEPEHVVLIFRVVATNDLRVAIVGSGIGGLSLGLALREHGIAAEIFETAPELTEIGAAVSQSANATRLFHRLGLLEEYAKHATMPTELIYRDWRHGERIAAHPVGQGSWYPDRFGYPYLSIHRADLQRILGEAFGSHGLHLGCQLINIVDEADGVRLEFASGRVEHADVVVGADGVRSTVRRSITGENELMYSGTSGFRGIVPQDKLASLPDPGAIQFWMGPDAHLLHFPIGGNGEDINFLAVVEGPSSWDHDGKWQVAVEADEPVSLFEGWHPAVTEMLDAVPHSVRWGLFVLRPLLRWYQGRKVLLGDSAHAMLPHHGQGANTTVEDAFTLAALLAEARPDDLEPVFHRYQALRRARTRKIQRSSWVTNRLLHLPDGSEIAARNQKMTTVPQDFAWIHEFDVDESLAKGPLTETVSNSPH